MNYKGIAVASGVNDIHPSLADKPERRVRPAKYLWTEHAERNAIYDAALRGMITRGMTMYCPWVACADCGRAIVAAGIERVVGHKHARMAARADWATSIAVADEMFAEAGVEIVRLEVVLGERAFFDGEWVEV